MKKRISIAVSVVALALLLIAGTVAVTVAYLTSVKQVTNTFTVGKVEITLDETTGDEYHLIPGKTLAKDPIVTVAAKSEACYVFVKVENGISGIEAADTNDTKTIATQLSNNGWTALNGVAGVWYQEVAKADTDQSLPVFANFTIKDDVDNSTLATYNDQKIIITAYAIQSEGLADATAAWNAVKDIQP